MDVTKLPVSSRVRDDRDLPAHKKPSKLEILLDEAADGDDEDALPQSRRRATPLAKSAGVADIEDAARRIKTRKETLYGDEK